jgi:hypothetical protein
MTSDRSPVQLEPRQPPTWLGYRLALIARQARAEFDRCLGEAGASFASWTVLETLAVRVR